MGGEAVRDQIGRANLLALSVFGSIFANPSAALAFPLYDPAFASVP
jgi:hypothetical protein